MPTAETSAHDRSRPPSLDDARAVIPIETIEELIETAVSVIETGEPAEELERVLDAVGRLPVERSAGFSRSTAALARRCRAIIDHRDSRVFSGADARADIAAVLWSWATGALVSATVQASEGSGAGAFLSARAAELAASPRDDAPRSTVALPTHVGGWIDPTQLVERLRSHPPASRLDLVAALLRLAIEGRPEALRAARDLEGESGAALRYALGGDERIGATASWWVAAARVRAPGEDDDALERRHPGLGPDAGRAARASIVAPAGRTGTTGLALVVEPRAKGPAALDLPTVLPYRSALARWWSGPSTPMLRWIATVQPGDREPWATVGSLVMARNLDWWSAEWANRVYLEPFIDPLTRVGPQARRLLGIALGAKEAGERGLASDIVGLLLGDGRLTGGSLGGGLIAAAELGCDRPARWAFSLADVAARSPGHAAGVVEAIGTTMAAIADRRPGTLVPLLRLLEELLAAVGGSLSPEAGVTLQSLAGRGGQTGRLARSIAARP